MSTENNSLKAIEESLSHNPLCDFDPFDFMAEEPEEPKTVDSLVKKVSMLIDQSPLCIGGNSDGPDEGIRIKDLIHDPSQ